MSFDYKKWKEEHTENSGGASSTSSVKPIPGGFDYAAYKSKKESVPVEDTPAPTPYYQKNNFAVSSDEINNWSNKDYKMTSDDKSKFKQLKKTITNKELRSMSDSDYQKYIAADNNSRSTGIAFQSGLLKGMIPFLDTIEKKAKGSDKAIDYALDTANASEEQHKLATGLGKFTGTALDYNVIGKAKGLEKLSSGIGQKLGGSALANSVGRIGADTLVDIGLDTVPELVDNIADGKSAGEVTKDALKNVGVNALFNVGGEVVGNLIDKKLASKASDAVKQSDEVADAVKTTTKEPNAVLDTLRERSKDFVDEGDVLKKDLGKDVNLNAYTEAKKLAARDYSDEVVEAYKQSPQIYNVLHNAQTKEEALDIIAKCKDDNELYSTFKSLLADKNPRATILGDVLSKRYFDNGDIEHGVEVIESLAIAMTEAGQFTQSAIITMTKNNPRAAMRMMQKNIDKINAAGLKKFGKKWQDFKLTDDEIKAFNDIKPGDKTAIENLFNKITDRIGESYPSSMWDKIVTTTKTSMMLNPRTHIRNLAANSAMLPVRSLTDRVSALGQNAYKLFNPDFEVTQSLVGGSKAQKNIANEIFDNEIKPLLEGESKWEDVAKNVVSQKRTYGDNALGTSIKNGTIKVSNAINNLTNGKMQKLVDALDENMTGSTLENLKRLDYWLLGAVEDDPFVKKNFSNRLASYMKAQNITNAADVPNEAIQIAYQEALKATFKDDNYMTKAFKGIKDSTGKFGEVLLPFVKTPANIAKRGIEYSPVGFIETLKTAKGKDAKEVIDMLAKNAVGTVGIYLGYKLAESGLIQGALSSDSKEKQFEEMQGKKAFSIKAGDTYWTFDWAQPASIPLIIGSTIYDAIKESDDEVNKLDLVKQASIASFDAWANLSPLQSFTEILGGGSYSSTPGENVFNAVTEFPQRLFPALVNAIAKTEDTTARDTYVKGDPLQSYKNTMQSKVPGLSKELPAKRDAWGREVKRQDSKGQAFVANFLNPGQLGYNASTPIDEEIQRIGAYPNAVNRYIKVGNQNVNLTNEQHSEYQKAMGEYSYDMAETFLKSSAYKSLDDESRKDILSNMYSVAKSMAENEVINKPIPDASKKYVDAYKKYGADGLVMYYDIKNNSDEDGNGSLKQDELKSYLDSMNVSREYKSYYWTLIFPKAKNNPYK